MTTIGSPRRRCSIMSSPSTAWFRMRSVSSCGGLLAARYGLEPDGIDDLIEAAEAADKEAVDLYGFTSILKRRLDASERERIVEMMWQLVFADGKVHEFEDNLIWRVAELLGVSSQTRIRLKQAARGDAGT